MKNEKYRILMNKYWAKTLNASESHELYEYLESVKNEAEDTVLGMKKAILSTLIQQELKNPSKGAKMSKEDLIKEVTKRPKPDFL